MIRPTVLLVEDEPAQREMLAYNLEAEGFDVITADNGEDGLILVDENDPDLIVLDWMMPQLSGIEVCRRLKSNSKTRQIPVIMLSARAEEVDRVRGLETGADDYLPKPFEPKELLLRINNILKKTKKVNLKHVLEFGSIKIDLNKLMITNQNSNFKINNTEKTILEKMINNPGKVFSRIDIGNLIKIDKERSIDVIITRLRKKIETNPKNPKYLQTIRGSGYVLWVE